HYKKLLQDASFLEKTVQCPFGFSSFVVRARKATLAFTGVIPFPRMGGEKERRMAKSYPTSHIDVVSFRKARDAILVGDARMAQLEAEIIKREAFALHEIRKLNRTVKQEAERLCLSESPNNPAAANPQFVKIWKSSELMSVQFEVIELLANETLFTLP